MHRRFTRLFTILLSATLLLTAQTVRKAHTVTIDGRVIRYEVRDGLAVTEGDIILGDAAELEAAQDPKNPTPRAATIYLTSAGNPAIWPDGTIYYTISASLPNQQRVLDAIAHWQANTPLRLVARTGQANYVNFQYSADSCSSYPGMVGGRQPINLADGCPTAAVIHEIGHAFGLAHEQTRADRNAWVTVLYENIDSINYSQYGQERTQRDSGYYDFDSIMHYSPAGFSLDGHTSMETVPPGILIGQRVGLSGGDVDNIVRIYGYTPTDTTVTTMPTGLSIVVDGTRYTAPHKFSWGPGSTHNIAVDAVQDTGAANTLTRQNFVRWTDGGALSHDFTATANQTVVAAEFQQLFKVQAAVATGSGTVSVQPAAQDGFYVSGSKVTVSATPAAGQNFVVWADGTAYNMVGRGTPSFTFEVRAPTNLPAVFSSQPISTVAATVPGLTVTVDGTSYYSPVSFAWAAGTSHTFSTDSTQESYSGSSRYTFDGWADGPLSAARTVQAGTEQTTYTAQFKTQHFLDYDWSGVGTVTANPQTDGYYDAGSTVQLTALPRGNSVLQYWLGDIAGANLTPSVVMDRPRAAYAIFGNDLNLRPTNAASYLSTLWFDQPGTYVAPLEIITLFGSGLGPDALISGTVDSNGRLSTTVGNTRVLFDGVAAPIIYASAKQTAVVVPAQVSGKTFTVITVQVNGAVTGVTTASVAVSLPGLFTSNASGSGQVAAFNQDYSLNSAERPAEAGTVVTLYATGAGLMDRALTDGQIMDTNLARPQVPVYARIGTLPADVLYAGSAPTLVNGALQVNVRIPAGLPSGNQPIKIITGAYTSPPGTTIAVK
ncbi:MAG: M12 family metallopeptidase [Acidobacteriota bacterium]